MDGAVVLGNASDGRLASKYVQTTSATVGGITYGGFAGSGALTDGSVVSVGAPNAERQIKNVAAGQISATSTDAINGSQLNATNVALGNVAAGTVAALGGNAAVNPDGTLVAPSYTVTTNPSTGDSTTVSNVGAALTGLNEAVNQPLTFVGDAGDAVERQLGSTLNVVGGVTDPTKLSDNNIGVVADGADTLTVKLAKDIDLTPDGSVTVGGTVVDATGITIAGSTADPTTNVSLTQDGLNNGGNQIVNVASGVTDAAGNPVTDLADAVQTNAVNVGDLRNVNDGLTTAGLNFTANDAAAGDVHRDLGQTLGILGEASTAGTYSGANVKTVTDPASGAINVQIADAPVFTGTVTSNTGFVVTDGPSMTTSGINANNTVITNVAPGVAGTDAVNMNQLTASKSTVTGDQGVSVTPTTNTDGSTTYTVAAKTDGVTTTVNADGNIAAITSEVTAAADGSVTTPAAPDALATAGDVANAINNSGFTLTAQGDAATGSVVNPGETVDLNNTDGNIVVSKVAGTNDVTFDLAPNLTIGDDTTPGTLIVKGENGADGVAINGKDGTIGLNGANGMSIIGMTGANGAPGVDGVTTTRIEYTPAGSTTPETVATLKDGLVFGGDTGADVTRPLNTKLDIVGGADTALLSDNNIGVVADGADTLTVKLAKELAGLTSAQFTDGAGNTTSIAGNSVVLGNGTQTTTLSTVAGTTTDAAGNSTPALSVGGSQIADVSSGLGDTKLADATGATLTNAVNVGDLQTSIADVTNAGNGGGFGLKDENGVPLMQDLGTAVAVQGDGNITTSVVTNTDGSKALEVALSNDLTVGGPGANGAPGKDGAIGVRGADGSTGVAINGKDGTIGLDGKDGSAVIGINGTNGAPGVDGTSVTRIEYTPAGSTTPETVATLKDGLVFGGDTGADVTRPLNTKLDIVGGADTALLSDNNIGVVADGADTLTVKLAKELAGLTSAQFTDGAGNTTSIAGNSVVLGNGTQTTTLSTVAGTTTDAAGNSTPALSVGGSQIADVSSGLGDTKLADATGATLTNAVNVGDLQTSIADVTNAGNGGGFGLKDENGVPLMQDLGTAVAVQGDGNITTSVVTNTDGSKALEVALSNDLTVGGPGANGAPGKDGAIGVRGADGSTGVAINGKDGTIGLDGKDGSAVIGINGTNGAPGVDGTSVTRIEYTDPTGTTQTVATLNDGLNFAGNTGDVIAKKLSETLTIKGGLAATAAASDANLRVDSVGGALVVKMAKDLTDLNSATFTNPTTGGTTVVNGDGLTIAGGPSVTVDGIDAGNQQITSVASGLTDAAGNPIDLKDAAGDTLTNAANIGDLQTAVSSVTNAEFGGGFGLMDENGVPLMQNLGTAVKVQGDGNITTSVVTNANGSKALEVALSNDLTVGGPGANGAPGKDGAIGVRGADGSTGVAINGKDGTIGLDGKDGSAVIGINGTNGAPGVDGTSVTRIEYTPAGSTTPETVATLKDGLVFGGDTGADVTRPLNTKLDIVGGADPAKLSDGNIGVVADGASSLTVKLAQDLNLTPDGSVKMGDTIVDGSGITIANGNPAAAPVSLTKDGLDNGGNQIVNVASGLTDATGNPVDLADAVGTHGVNVDDLRTAIDGAVGGLGGFGLTDDAGTAVTKPLGNTIQVKGDGNITTAVVDTANGKALEVGLAADINIGGPGADGLPGKDGTLGVNGADGKSGVALNGKDGTIGLTGPAGANGAPGASATIGVAKGEPGLNGTDGVTRLVYTPAGSTTPEEVATMNDGLNFAGNSGPVVSKKLNETLTVKGGLANTADASSSNIRVDSEGGALVVKLADSPTFAGTVSAKEFTAGNTTVNNGGVTINNADPTKTVSLSDTGLNNGGNTITNVAPGKNGTDAVNVNQLFQSHQSLSNRIDEVDKNASAGSASAMAAAGLPQAYLPGKSMAAMAGATYRGESALAVGVSTITDNGKWVIKGTVNTNTQGHMGATIGAGYQW